ncbi:UNKNOWN [Stylonychia lemnae]|uniref:Fucolectin tachylectin-4 pentraxin-1 domain-containing protein n=1 Tax=Stylonychia lemnae TaxID=5949 RepID=A0A078AFI1_STYLE|nr:UNKNOWN [Stylonychia lemnae]|eukprot:CDW80955.1 UNKNOWN [Stylonychia lemnae]
MCARKSLLIAPLLLALISGRSINVLYRTRAWQSSTASGGDAGRAVDGNTSPIYSDGSCTHTNSGVGNWWISDMYDVKHIQTVMIFNREDAGPERLTNYQIRVGNSSDPGSNPICFTNQGTGGGIFSCDQWGRYLAIVLNSNNPLTLCEVKAFEGPNIALNHQAVQSSTSSGGDANRPIRNNFFSSYWGKNTCTHTNQESQPYWYVDLGSEQLIAGVSIASRWDCCGERTTNYQVVVGNSADVNLNTPCSGNPTRDADVYCGLSGRFVGIKASNQVLHLCGIAIITGTVGAPTGYWEMVGSGENIVHSFERGVQMTDGTETTTSDTHTVSISIEQSFSFFKIGESSVSMGYEYSRSVASTVRKDITKHVTTGCSSTCMTDGSRIVYVWQWMMKGTNDWGAVDESWNLFTCNFVCRYEPTSPRCPLTKCADKECNTCTNGVTYRAQVSSKKQSSLIQLLAAH